MNYRDWPDEIKGNQFTLAKLNPDESPELKVRTWSNLFGRGGQVSIDAGGTTLAAISIDRDGDVSMEREHLQDLVDEWNEDPAGNWRRLIEESRFKVLAYHERQVVESQKALERARRGDWS
jgi:hypothetical protein